MTVCSLRATDPPAISPLSTTGVRAHPLTGDCPVACLDGLLSRPALNRLLTESLQGELSAIEDLVGLYRTRRLSGVPGIGPGRTTEIEELLLAAGLISASDCYLVAAASEHARRRRNWLAVIDGPVIRYLRQSQGFSQAHVARMSGLSAAAIATAEREPASYCRRSTLDRLAAALGVPPGGLEHPAHQWLITEPRPAARWPTAMRRERQKANCPDSCWEARHA